MERERRGRGGERKGEEEQGEEEKERRKLKDTRGEQRRKYTEGRSQMT